MKKRPINLDLFSTRFPITAIVSILHRLSGVFLFLLIPLLLWSLQSSLGDAPNAGSKTWEKITSGHGFKLFIWFTLSALVYHLFAGLRHLAMDMGWGDSLCAARITAKTVLILSIVYSIWLGAWLWF